MPPCCAIGVHVAVANVPGVADAQVAGIAHIPQVAVLAQINQAERGQQPIEQHDDQQDREDGGRKTEDDGQELGHETPFSCSGAARGLAVRSSMRPAVLGGVWAVLRQVVGHLLVRR